MKNFWIPLFAAVVLWHIPALEAQTSYFEGTLQFSVELEGAEAEALKVNEPNTQLTMHLKGGDYIVQLMGGRYPKTFVFLSDSNYEYTFNPSEAKAYRYSIYADLNKEKTEARAIATGKTAEVAGVFCQEYQMKTTDAVFLYYVNDAYRVNVSLFPAKPNTKASFLVPGLEGRIPLKTIIRRTGLVSTNTVIKITQRPLKKEQFMIPTGFEVKNRDYRF